MANIEPQFYGTWEGRVLEAIAVENIRNWNWILEYTQSNNKFFLRCWL